MSHDQVVYKLVRDGRSVYCASFAVVSALLGVGWALRDWGRRARFAAEVAAGSRRRYRILRNVPSRQGSWIPRAGTLR
jgi:hypothetical protein